MKVLIIIFLVISSFAYSQFLYAGGAHVIVYPKHLEAQANRLADHLNQGDGTEKDDSTKLVSLEDIKKYYAYISPNDYWPPEINSKYKEFWNANGFLPTKLMAYFQGVVGKLDNDPVFPGMGKRLGAGEDGQEDDRTVKYVTLLGNEVDIPPSYCTDINVSETLNKNTDFWYSLRNFDDFIPDHSISRVPISINDPSNQVFEIDELMGHGIFSGDLGSYTRNGLLGLPLGYLSDKSSASYPYMYDVIENSQTDAGGNTHVLFDALRPEQGVDGKGYDVRIKYTTQSYAFISFDGEAIRSQESTIKGDLIVWKDDNGYVTGPSTGFAKMITDPKGPKAFGEKTVMLAGYEEAKEFANGIAFSQEVFGNKANNIKVTIGKVNNGEEEFDAIWPTYDGSKNYVIEVTKGTGKNNIYIPTSWSLSGNTVTIEIEQGGDSPNNLNKDSFLELYTVADLNVIPSDADVNQSHCLIPPLKKPMHKDQPYAFIYNNQDVADGFIDKFIAYNDALASGDYEFADKIIFGSNRSYSSTWVFENEQRTVDLINSKNPSLDGGEKSLFNGFHVYKGFETNNDDISNVESPMARFSSHASGNFVKQISGKGFAALNDNWVDVIGNSFSVQLSPFSSPSMMDYQNLEYYMPKLTSPHLTILTSDVLEYFPRYNLYKILNPFHGKQGHTADRIWGTSYEQEMMLFSSRSSSFHGSQALSNGEYAGFIAAFGHNRQGARENFIDIDSLGTDHLEVINGKVDIGSFFTHEILHHGVYTSYAESGKTDPYLGDLWKGAFIYLYDEYRRKHNKMDLSDRDVAEEIVDHVKGFVSLGVAGMKLPIRRDWKITERNVPEISIDEEQLRGFKNGKLGSVSYDSDGLPIFEVKDGETKTIKFNIEDDGVNTYRVTLFSPQLMTSRDDGVGLNKIESIDASLLTMEHVVSSKEITGTVVEYDFHENWKLVSGNIQRGPGVYMLKVEALEPDRSSNLSITETARKPHYFKETRLIFKVVNEFKEKLQVPFLLVDNIQRDQFNIRTDSQEYISPNLRYYEAALDNYQYTRGLVAIDSLNSDNVNTTFIAVDPKYNTWGEISGSDNLQRIRAGDKIKFLNLNDQTYTPWYRISSTIHSDEQTLDTIQIDADQAVFASGNFINSRYIIQRAFTEGYAETVNNIDPVNGKKIFGNEIFLFDDQGGVLDDTLSTREIIRVGDWFKFVDEGSYRQINAIEAIAGNQFKLTLGETYPAISMNLAYVSSVYPDALSESSYKGSYAIYPDMNGEPSYNYRTWRINNYNLTNDLGQGLHGELDSQSLLEYSQGLRGKYRVVIWANDSIYTDSTFDSSLLVLPELSMLNYDYFLFSPRHKDILNSFFNSGGRLFTASQFLTTTIERNTTHGLDPYFFKSNPSFFENYFGLSELKDDQAYVFSQANNGLTAILNKENDIISGDINELKITGGLTAHTQNNIDEEASGLGSRNTDLKMSGNSDSVPFITYDPASLGEGTTPDSDFIAGVRMSDGPDAFPFASVLLGFDFGAISQSGTNNKDKEGELELRFGRNFLMKQSIDYLRDPTRTSSEDQLQITYYAKGADLNQDLVSIDLPKEPVINVRHEHLANDLHGGIYMGGQLRFSATGGKIFDKEKYTWTLTSRQSGSGTKPYIGNNEGDLEVVTEAGEQLVYFCGNKPGVDLLRVVGPDGSVKVLEIKVDAPELSLDIDLEDHVIQTGSLPKIQALKGHDDYGSINIVANGGLGSSSYSFNIVPGNDLLSDSSLLEHSPKFPINGIKYKLSAVAAYSVDTIKKVTVQVISGSQMASASFLVTAPVKIKEENHVAVVGGDDAKIVALEGDPDGVYELKVETSTSANAEVIHTDENNVFFINATEAISTDPTVPDVVDVTVTSLDNSYSTNVLIYSVPIVEYQIGGGELFRPSENSYRTELDQTNLLALHVSGGTGQATFEVIKTDLEGLSGNIFSFNGVGYTEGDVLNLEYGSTPPVVKIIPGNRIGSVTYKIVSGGSVLIREVRFQAFTIDPKEIIMNSSEAKRFNMSRAGVPPYTWTMINPSVGKGFAKSSDAETYAASMITSSIDEPLYFFSDGRDDVTVGFVQVEDSIGNIATATVLVNPVEKTDSESVTNVGTKIPGDEVIFTRDNSASSGGCLLKRRR